MTRLIVPWFAVISVIDGYIQVEIYIYRGRGLPCGMVLFVAT